MDTSKTIKGYEKKERIGKGGCGAVYLAQKENKNYALKKITDLTKDEIE
jgi:serine/threonine protein kinase